MRLVPKCPIPWVPAVVWVSDPVALVFLWANAVLRAQRCRPQQRLPGAAAGGEPGDAAQPLQSQVQSHVRLMKTNKRKGKAILLLTPRAARLRRRGCAGSHDRRQHSRSIPRQAQAGAAGSDSPAGRSSRVTGLPATHSHRPVASRAICVTSRYRNRAGSRPAPAPGEQPKHGASLWLSSTERRQVFP